MLTAGQIEDFIKTGMLHLSRAFDRSVAHDMVQQSCRHAGLANDNADSFDFDYGTLEPMVQPLPLADFAPLAWECTCELLGGADRLADPPIRGGDFVVNASFGGDRPWCPPTADFRVWHIDSHVGSHRIRETARDVALVVILHFHDEEPQSGGTFVSPDSVRVVARHIAAHPEGVPNDKSNDYLSFLADQCDNFQEHCAQAGDATILHPFLLHGQSRNPSGRARFIFNLQAVMSTDFDLESGSSAVEQAIMRAISDI